MRGSEASLLPPSVDSVLSRRAIRVFALLSAGMSLRLCKLVTTVLAAGTRVDDGSQYGRSRKDIFPDRASVQSKAAGTKKLSGKPGWMR